MTAASSRQCLATAFGTSAPVSEAAIESLAPLFRAQSLGARRALAHPGEPLDEVLVVVSGLLRFYAVDDDGREWNKAFVTEGELCGAFLPGDLPWPAPHGLEALENCELLRAPWPAVRALSAAHPDIDRALQARTRRLLAEKGRRLQGFQQKDALDRYCDFLAREPQLAQRLPQHHVASFLGISEVSLSRLRARLRS